MTRKIFLTVSALAAAALAIFPVPAAACGECEVENGIGLCELQCDGCGSCTLCPANPGCGTTCGNGACDGDDCTACVEDCTAEQCANDCSDGICDPMLDCFCGDGQGDCTIAGCTVDEQCRNGTDDDGDGFTDCDDSFCTGSSQCCGGDETARMQCMNAQETCVEDLTVSAGCCSNGTDNDGDGAIDLDDPGCNSYTCEDPCADNNGQAGTDCDVDPMGAPCCTYGGHGVEAEGGVDCCSDGYDNDNDTMTDGDDALDCPGGGCTAVGSYNTSATCSGVVKALSGTAEANIGLSGDGSCGAADFLASNAATYVSAICSTAAGSYLVGGGTTGVDYFAFDYSVAVTCPSGQRMLSDGTCTSCPIGTVPLPGGGCSCADGDADGDGICDSQDPCDAAEFSDADLTSVSVAASRGLESDGTNCACSSYVRDLSEGSTGPDVATLQTFLEGLGHLSYYTLGYFDSNTLVGLHYYQMAAGLSESYFDEPTRSQVNSDTGGPVANGGTYDAAGNVCEAVVLDLCNNFDDVQNQDWVDGAGLESVPDPDNEGEFVCVCPGQDNVDCPNTPTDYCTEPGECCSPEDFWYCDELTPPECIANEECCGGCCGLTGQELTCCEDPAAAGCTPPVCTGLTGQALTCCETPNDSSCRSCPSGYSYCSTTRSCVQNAADCPVLGCYPTSAASGARDPFAQVVSYCTVVAAETDGADADTYGDFYKPWRVGTGASYEYQTLAALDAFFGAACNNGVPAGCAAGDLVRILEAQKAARLDSPDLIPTLPVYGKVTRDPYGASCSGTPCEHGEECALSVGSGGAIVTASCVPTYCDPCDPSLDPCPGNSGGSNGQGNAFGGGDGDGACCRIDDPSICCEPGDVNCPVCTPGEDGCIPLRGVAIEAVPNVIDAASNGRCLVVWASQGMASVEITGFGIDPELADNFAGSDEVGPTVSSVYRISGLGTDGETYEATDLCATNPVIKEL